MTEMLSFIVKPKLNQSHKRCHMGSLCLSSSVSGTTGSHVHDKCKEISSSVVRTQLLMQMYGMNCLFLSCAYGTTHWHLL